MISDAIVPKTFEEFVMVMINLKSSNPVGLEAHQEVKFLHVAVKVNGYPILKAKNKNWNVGMWNKVLIV